MKPAKNLTASALFLALAASLAFAAVACGDSKPPMTPDGTSDDGGAAPPSTDAVPRSLPTMPNAGSLTPPK